MATPAEEEVTAIHENDDSPSSVEGGHPPARCSARQHFAPRTRGGPGGYRMRNALKLRDNLHLVGVPGKTVLVACDGFASHLAADGDANERQITVADASGFRVGDGFAVQDSASGGFEVTTATLTA